MIKSTENNVSFLYEASLPPLGREQEYELAVKMGEGDKKARETLIRANIRFAIKEAYKYKKMKLDFDDLVAIAIVGLIKGVDHFDVSRNSKLITCASWWIRAEFSALCKKTEDVLVESSSEALERFLMNKADESSMSPEESAMYSCFMDDFYKNVRALPSVERTVLLMHNGLCGYSKLDYAEIGNRYGKTKQWAWLQARTAEQTMAKKLCDWMA